MDGAKLTLLPSVETGLVPQRPEQCVMQALETLNDTQVDNFLAGRAPLNLTMRLGDHMMFIQLQLSTVEPSPSNRSSNSTSNGIAPDSSLPTPPTTPTTPDSPNTALRFPNPSPTSAAPLSPPPSPKMTVPQPAEPEVSPPKLNTRALAEASRNLTHTLRQLSSVALNKKMNESCDGRCCTAREQGGAVIESMFHHGRGVYSGTFSGTLNPSLQDKDGRPRRDISTIVHILNDLLGASAHCRPSSQCLCPTSSSSTTTSSTSSQNVLNSTTLQVKVDGQQKQEENQVLRQKIQQIQSMLEERRQRRKARRTSPYPTISAKSGSHAESSSEPAPIHPTEHGDQNMADYSSRTAVA